ncbi:hypothetical protein V8E36_007183 [Tilletia maclaganii]
MPSAIILLTVPGLDAVLAPPQRWAEAIRNGVDYVTRTISSDSTSETQTHERLTVIFSSVELFSAPFPGLSFNRLAGFLQWSYAQAWSAAVERDHLLLDVDVLLVPGPKWIDEVVRTRRNGGEDEEVFVMDEEGNLRSVPASTTYKRHASSSTSAPPDPETSATVTPLPQYPVVALGGTFDHLHPGHKILLGSACTLATRKLIVGITSDEMLASKAEPQLLESIERRKERVASFIESFTFALRGPREEGGAAGTIEAEVVTLRDVAGPAGTEADLQALVLTEETLAGGETIAKIRQENGLGPLEQHVIRVLGAKGEIDVGKASAGDSSAGAKDAKALAAAKVGSTAIRKWLAAKQSQS